MSLEEQISFKDLMKVMEEMTREAPDVPIMIGCNECGSVITIHPQDGISPQNECCLRRVEEFGDKLKGISNG